jgi:hypothetical protein
MIQNILDRSTYISNKQTNKQTNKQKRGRECGGVKGEEEI